MINIKKPEPQFVISAPAPGGNKLLVLGITFIIGSKRNLVVVVRVVHKAAPKIISSSDGLWKYLVLKKGPWNYLVHKMVPGEGAGVDFERENLL